MTSITYPETADIETSSDDYARRFSGAVGEWFLKVQEQATLAMLAPYPGASVLDVGGGHGQTTGALLRNGYRVTVFGSAESCKNRIQPYLDDARCNFKVGNILALPYEDRSFDIVLSYRLLPHVERWQPFLAELARVARKAVILDYPEVASVNAATPFLFGVKKQMEGNTRTYTTFRQAQVVAEFRQHGFSLESRYPEFFFPMVLHRKLGRPGLSAALERFARWLGLTRRFGSPVILKLAPQEGNV